LVALTVACGGDARFTANFASGFAPGRHTVSVLGVYKDGQMSSDAWSAIGPQVSPALGARTCEPGYGSAPVGTTDGVLSSAIEDYARANGPTDDLLAQLAPAAKGDLIVVITFAGRLPTPAPPDLGASAASAPTTGGARGAMGAGGAAAGGGRGLQGSRKRPTDTNVLDISASLYSVPQARSVALVSMEYSGASVQDAVSRFAAKLAQEVPASTCTGWDWQAAKVDAARIRASIE
jgi:hypothetical protein